MAYYDDYFEMFLLNCEKWECTLDGFVDILAYSKMYCEKDVEVLQKGYNKFGEMLSESCDMNIENFMSSA
eukprot:5705848-Prymnesium_polylepis.1